MKPTTPLLTPNKTPLKPPSPVRPKTAPKRPFLARKGDGGFNPAQARASKGDRGFKPPGHLVDRAWPGDRWAADVTNVVKSTRFKSPREDLCYKRRQSKPKNHHFQRKSHRIDDVCNNGAEIHTKNTSN